MIYSFYTSPDRLGTIHNHIQVYMYEYRTLERLVTALTWLSRSHSRSQYAKWAMGYHIGEEQLSLSRTHLIHQRGLLRKRSSAP